MFRSYSQNSKKYFIYSIFLLLCFIFIFFSMLKSYSNDGVLRVYYLNVGQGDATFIRSVDGKSILIDGGPNSDLLKRLRKFTSLFSRNIDVVILTNPDSDHIIGLIEVCNRFNIDYFIESDVVSTSSAYRSLDKCLNDKKIKRIIPRTGDRMELGNSDKGVLNYIEFYFPDRDVDSLARNDASLIFNIALGDTKFIFTGDSSKKIERYIVREFFLTKNECVNNNHVDTNINTDITKKIALKIGHHGSKTSTDEKMIACLKPEFAIISAGMNNRYGHPHKNTISTLDKYKIRTLKTYDIGNISIQSNGEELYLK